MRIKLPQQLKIGGHYYALSYEPGLEIRHNKMGTCDINGGQITIEPNSMESFKSSTLIHEILHIIDYNSCGKKMGEEIVFILAEAIWEFLEQHDITFDWSEIQ